MHPFINTHKLCHTLLPYYTAATGYGKQVLAGGAVANSILADIDGSSAIVNDVDIFNIVLNGRFDKKSKCPLRAGDIENDYGTIVKGAYQLLKTGRHDIINTVDIKFIAHQSLTTYRNYDAATIGAFDLNCTMAALSQEGVVTTDPAFDAFLRTRQLEIETLYTPFHSLIRYCKKMQQLRVHMYGNIEHQIIMVYCYLVNQNVDPDTFNQLAVPDDSDRLEELVYNNNCDCKVFGQKYAREYLQYGAELAPYMTLHHVRNLDQNNNIYVKDIGDHITSETQLGDRIFFTLIPTSRMCELGMKQYARYFDSIPDYNKFILSHVTPKLFVPMYRNLCLSKPRIRAQARLFLMCQRSNIASHSPEFFDIDLSKKYMDEIEMVEQQHPQLLRFLLHGKCASDIRKNMENLRRLHATYGDMVYGVIETMYHAIDTVNGEEVTVPDIIAKTEHIITIDSRPLQKQLCIPDYPEVAITHLIMGRALKDEGKRMRHCVGGYSTPVLECRSVIFHIEDRRDEKNRATLELRHRESDGVLQWYIYQLKGISNSKPEQLLRVVAEYIRAYCNRLSIDDIMISETSIPACHEKEIVNVF